jgi:hypothetical protein
MDRKTVMNNHMQIYSNENRYKSRRRNRMIAIGHREIRRELNLERGGRRRAEATSSPRWQRVRLLAAS